MHARTAYELFLSFDRLGHTLRTIAARCADGMPARFTLPTGKYILIDKDAGPATSICEVLHTDAPLVVPITLACPLDTTLDSSLARRYGPSRGNWPRAAYDPASDTAFLRVALAVTIGIKYARVRLAGVTAETSTALAASASVRNLCQQLMTDSGALALLSWSNGIATVVGHPQRVEPYLPPLKGELLPSPTDRSVAEFLACTIG